MDPPAFPPQAWHPAQARAGGRLAGRAGAHLGHARSKPATRSPNFVGNAPNDRSPFQHFPWSPKTLAALRAIQVQPGCRLSFTDTSRHNYAIFDRKQEYWHWPEGNLTHPRPTCTTKSGESETGGAVTGRRPPNRVAPAGRQPTIE